MDASRLRRSFNVSVRDGDLLVGHRSQSSANACAMLSRPTAESADLLESSRHDPWSIGSATCYLHSMSDADEASMHVTPVDGTHLIRPADFRDRRSPPADRGAAADRGGAGRGRCAPNQAPSGHRQARHAHPSHLHRHVRRLRDPIGVDVVAMVETWRGVAIRQRPVSTASVRLGAQSGPSSVPPSIDIVDGIDSISRARRYSDGPEDCLAVGVTCNLVDLICSFRSDRRSSRYAANRPARSNSA